MSLVPHRPTIRDVATAAGCHYSTVSLALRDRPRISTATRLKIRAAVDRLGYRPDASLSALCAYRAGKRPAQEHGVIAWLTNYRAENRWKGSACNCDYFEGASHRAAERATAWSPSGSRLRR